MTYARRWRAAWCVATAAGVGLAILEWSPAAVLLAVLLVSAFAGVCLVLVHTPRASGSLHLPSPGHPRVGPPALLVGGGVVAVSALTAASPPLTLLAAVLFVLSSPVVVRRCARRTADPAVVGSVEQLDDLGLCALWRRSFWQLQHPQSPDDLCRMVAVRQRCLDELERRNPDALHAWLSSGATASGGPEQFWTTRPDTGTAEAA